MTTREEITIYLETGNSAEIIGIVYGEELYMNIFPALVSYANDRDGKITESVK
jgi:hypothetical protein